MTTILKIIDRARNPEIKQLSFTEVREKLNELMATNQLLQLGEILDDAKIDQLESHEKTFNELMLEYHLFRSEFTEAYFFAKCVLEP